MVQERKLMPRMLTLPKRETEPFPVIEILGAIDIGKTYVAQLVARRLKGIHLSFPVLDVRTWTGGVLLASLSKRPRELENNPEWWAHVFAANLYEQKHKLIDLSQKMPVVVTNYTLAYRIWMKATGIDMSKFLKGFTVNLPQPTIGYVMIGNPLIPIDKPLFEFSTDFALRIKKGMNNPADKRVVRVNLQNVESKFHHVSVNNTAVAITRDIKERYKLAIDETALYNADYFMKKKDLE
jgi:hypothetical protein